MSASRLSPGDEAGRAGGGARPFRLRAVLFDFDGTLTRPGALDFAAIKRELGCPPERFVLEWVRDLADGPERRRALGALERFELDAAAASAPNEGAEDLVLRLRDLGVAVGILTRNGRVAVDAALRRFPSLAPKDFDVILTRDDGLAPKPAPDGVVHAARVMGARPGETLVVGDYLLDVQAGRAAGAVTAYLVNGGGGVRDVENAVPDAADCDFVVGRLEELDDVVRLGLPLPAGKLPNGLLAAFLSGVAAGDPALLVPPAIGEDVAVLELGGAELLVVHGDPITLGGDSVGEAAVLVNANDIAAAGAEPRWLLATVLLPPGTTPSEALAELRDLAAAAAADGLTLAGGHTEVTAAVTRPVVSLTALGTLPRAELRDKRAVRPGDRVVLTKALAVEGTALLAVELGERLRELGMTAAELEECVALSPQRSIVPEARVARRFAGVHAMHDVTEGGLATALRELAAATGRGVLVERERVPVSEATRRVCDLLAADPLGLIASGSLLICCDPGEAAALTDALAAAGIAAADIGEVTGEGAGVAALERGRPAPWPEFATDEVARLLARREAESGAG
jgi:hydrogenase expression/formation protein HypE